MVAYRRAIRFFETGIFRRTQSSSGGKAIHTKTILKKMINPIKIATITVFSSAGSSVIIYNCVVVCVWLSDTCEDDDDADVRCQAFLVSLFSKQLVSGSNVGFQMRAMKADDKECLERDFNK